DVLKSQDVLKGLADDEPRFFEARFFRGRAALAERRLLTAETEFLAAANGLAQSTAAWAMLGTTRLALEDLDAAAADYARALSLEPAQRESLLGRARALNEAGRFEEAIAPAR